MKSTEPTCDARENGTVTGLPSLRSHVSVKRPRTLHVGGRGIRVLNDEVERSNYDLILERKAKGLPTDPVLVLEADELFRKGQTFIRRGNAVAAEEGLARAVELNPTEPEYWSYFGWAYFSKHGEEGLERAKEALAKAQELKPELASAYEFLGRIARTQKSFAKRSNS